MKLDYKIFKEINLALSAALVCLLGLETLWPGSVLAYINLNYGLILWVLSVILVLFSYSLKDNSSNGNNH